MMKNNDTFTAVSDLGNSFITAPNYMKTGEIFDEIIRSCSFPETVPGTYIQLLNSWLTGQLYDAIFVDFVSWHTPTLVKVTQCLISAYAGGAI